MIRRIMTIAICMCAALLAAGAAATGDTRPAPPPPGGAVRQTTAWALRLPDGLPDTIARGPAGPSRGIDGARYARMFNPGVLPPTLVDLFDDVTFSPVLAGRLGDLIAAFPGDMARTAHLGFRLLGAPAGGFGPPPAGSPPVLPAPANGKEATDAILSLLDTATPPAGWERLPALAKRIVAVLLRAADAATPRVEASRAGALAELERTIGKQTNADADAWLDAISLPWRNRHAGDDAVFAAAAVFDLRALSRGTSLFLERTRALNDIETEGERHEFDPVVIETPWGPVEVRGTGDDVIEEGAAFVVDLGGNDRYVGGASATGPGSPPVAAVVDLGGDDVYDCTAGPALGFMGLAVLIDLDGNDRYRSAGSGIGAGFFGSGILVDLAGEDVYEGRGFLTQGAARLGLGMLCDLGGDDDYRCAGRGQAFGSTGGCGILLDARGDDRYAARLDGGDRRGAFTQGAALGRRADITDGRSLAGGYGILVDLAGDDAYDAGDWSIGAAYWFGAGCCYDRGGSDTRRSGAYSLGAAAHFGVACCVDLNGDDAYNAGAGDVAPPQCQGYAHDASVAAFVDAAGDDRYAHGNRAAGAADRGGVALFLDRSGDDRYRYELNGPFAGDRSYGSVPSLPELADEHSLLFPDGIAGRAWFLDTGGRDEYRTAGDAEPPLRFGNGISWRHGGGSGLDIDLVPPGPVRPRRAVGESF